ncbi:CAF1 family ribonuclease domain-containing protein [Ditylenchus destructor]|nr:CAF1 family ribonuclease domain-containing protein [Ditylenchus destructor]
MVAQEVNVHDVWCSNLEEEFAKLRGMIEDYPFVAMDTEFPGVVLTPMGQYRSKEDFNYQQLLCNVNALKLIQVGITLMDRDGCLPPGNDVWQFNLHFDTSDDMYSTDSIELLRTAGFDFSRHQSEGILMEDFGELLTTSGLLVEKSITWITFHSCFDFGYLIRSILLGKLPEDEEQFARLHRALFPTSYDIKTLIRHPDTVAAQLKGSLQDVADQLQVPRIGTAHQAGSDSLLTAMTFFKLKERFFSENWEEVAKELQGHMYGLNFYDLKT